MSGWDQLADIASLEHDIDEADRDGSALRGLLFAVPISVAFWFGAYWVLRACGVFG